MARLVADSKAAAKHETTADRATAYLLFGLATARASAKKTAVMVALAKQKRHVPANVWRAARALYATDPRLTLERVAERFDLSLPAVRKRSSRERWRERDTDRPGASLSPNSGAVVAFVPPVTLRDFRKAVQEEACALLCLLRQARQTAEHDPIEAIRAIVPTLERLGRIAETAFEPVAPEYGFGGTKGLIHPSVFLAEGLPPRAVNRDKAPECLASEDGSGECVRA